jgi:branched-chain amino acid transport system permease protein
MIRFIASLIGGLTLGGTIALMGLGLVLAFRATKTFNFAHGELILLPAFIVGYMEAGHTSFGISLVVALVTSAAVGILFYVLVLRKTTGLPLFMAIVATFGLAAILDGIMGIAFQVGQYQVTIPGVPQGSVKIAGAQVSESSLTFAGLTIVISIIVVIVIRFTHLGLMIMAAGQDPVLASQCGLPVRRLHMGSWAAASVLAGIAGITYASSASADNSMISLGLAALPAIMLGGLDSIEGAVVGGLIIGLLQGFAQTYLGGQSVDALTYVVLLLVLLLYPQGLFGTKEVVRA